MQETIDDPTRLDALAWPIRYLRGTLQMFAAAAIIVTDESDLDVEEAISLTYGWGSTTCIDQFDEFNAIGQWEIRFASAPFALYLWWFYSHLLLEPVGALALIAHYWILGQLVLLAAYDPLAGILDTVQGTAEVPS